jgi:hypothetical protein
MAHGEGMYIHIDGSEYRGGWVMDKQHGEGIETWPDKSYYKGKFENGKKSG